MKFFTKNARFIVPIPFIIVALLNLWNAFHDSKVIHYIISLAFFGAACLFYISQRHLHMKSTVDDSVAKDL